MATPVLFLISPVLICWLFDSVDDVVFDVFCSWVIGQIYKVCKKKVNTTADWGWEPIFCSTGICGFTTVGHRY